MSHDRMSLPELIATLTARDDLTELEHVLLDRLIRAVSALNAA
jgi:hypothetical protein